MSFAKKILITAVLATVFFGIVAIGAGQSTTHNFHNAKSDTVVLNSIGTSTISLSQTTIDINSGSSGSVSYTVKLSSGTTWGTTISDTAPSGFTTSFSTSSGDPTFSGTATIKVADTVKNGTYTISFTASGDDPTSSATTLTVQVSGYTPGPTPITHTTTTSSSSDNSIYIGIGIFAIFAVFSFVPLISRRMQIDAVGYISYAISIVSAIYLAAYDHTLYNSAYLHWIILVVFVILSLIVFILSLFYRSNVRFLMRTVLSVGSFVMSVGMILDAALGLPLTSVQNIGSTAGFTYLFGFGAQSGSTLAVSVAFTLFLIFNGLVFSSFLRSKAVKSDKPSK